MPNFGPGIPNNVNLSYTATWLFTPSTFATNNVRLVNNGRTTVYVGQADVTVNTGLPITPGSKPVELTNVLTPLYAITQVQLGSIAGTIGTSGTAGTTALTVATTASATALSSGQLIAVQSTAFTSNLEVLSVSGSSSTTGVTVATATQFAHDTTNVVYNATAQYGLLSVYGGVV